MLRLGLFSACLVMACGSAAAPEPAALGSILRLIGPFGLAHACPIAPTRALTSRHVVLREDGPRVVLSAFLWSARDADDQIGSAWVLDYDLRRDLALLALDPPTTPIVRATEAPAIGTRVVLLAYRDGLQPERVSTRILAQVAGHLVLESPGAPGMSGGCVLDEAGRAVGVFQWSIEFRGRARGLASAIWGPWADVSWLPPAEEAR